jgi:hypothetical protein
MGKRVSVESSRECRWESGSQSSRVASVDGKAVRWLNNVARCAASHADRSGRPVEGRPVEGRPVEGRKTSPKSEKHVKTNEVCSVFTILIAPAMYSILVNSLFFSLRYFPDPLSGWLARLLSETSARQKVNSANADRGVIARAWTHMAIEIAFCGHLEDVREQQ